MSLKLPQLVVEATRKQTATLIFLHGSGDSGVGIKDWIESALGKPFNFPHVKLIFPSAPVQYYEAYRVHQPVWFQRKKLKIDSSEDEPSIEDMCAKIEEIVKKEVEAGIPNNRIIIGGFSMGGGLSLYCGYYALIQVAGIFALSSFLSRNSIVYRALKKRAKEGLPPTALPPLFQAHGDVDGLIPLAWGKESIEGMRSLGVEGRFKVYPGLDHNINRKCVEDFIGWVNEVVSDGGGGEGS